MKLKSHWIVASALAALAWSAPFATAQLLHWGANAPATAAQDRVETVAHVIDKWGTALERSTPGLTRGALREMLQAMPEGYLLAASVADSLETVRAVLVSAPMESAFRKANTSTKALGDPAADLVYTPVSPPCRLFDTRVSQSGGGTLIAGGIRTYGATAAVPNQGGPGNCAAAAGSVVALMVIGTVTPSGNGLIQGGPGGTMSFPNALILFQPGDQYGTEVAMPLNLANGQFSIVSQFASTEAYGDLLGYFRPSTPPGATNGFINVYTTPPTTALGFLSGTVQLTIAGSKAVFVESTAAMGSFAAGGASGLNLWICYRAVPSGTITSVGGGIFGLTVVLNERKPMGMSAIVTGLAAGTYQFGLCGSALIPANWNNNEWSYTTAFVLN